MVSPLDHIDWQGLLSNTARADADTTQCDRFFRVPGPMMLMLPATGDTLSMTQGFSAAHAPDEDDEDDDEDWEDDEDEDDDWDDDEDYDDEDEDEDWDDDEDEDDMEEDG
jgi:hypothetical protein